MVRRRVTHDYWFRLISVCCTQIMTQEHFRHWCSCTTAIVYSLRVYSVVVVSCGTYHTAASPRRKPAQAKFENLPAKTSDSPLKPHTKKRRKFCKQAVNQHTHLLSMLLPYNTSLAAEADRTARGSQPDRWSSQHTLTVGGFFQHKAGAHT